MRMINALVLMQGMMNALAGERFSKKQILTRFVALLMEQQHFLVCGMSLRQVARRFRISESALSRGRRAITPLLTEATAQAQKAFDSRINERLIGTEGESQTKD